MSRTISLEEALKMATRGPFKRRGHERRMEGGGGRLVCGFPFYAQAEVRTDANIALLSHAFNLFPEVVERLRWYAEREDQCLFYGPIEQGITEILLKKAEKITLPE